MIEALAVMKMCSRKRSYLFLKWISLSQILDEKGKLHAIGYVRAWR
jgi:hypothetical protein